MTRPDHALVDSSGLLDACWAAVGGDADALAELELTGFDAWLGGSLAVDGFGRRGCGGSVAGGG